MKKLFVCLLLIAASPLLFAQAPAQARTFNQAELDALLAPIALYPDVLLTQILDASTRPGQVAQAARWTKSNPGLAGEDAVSAAQDWGWHPSVTALVAFPDVLQRMDENPQWLSDLSEAYRESEPYVMETVQQLRRRAEAAGNLQSDGQQEVYRQGDAIVVQPAYPQYVVAPYYNPLVVFGTWWWTSYRPVVWRPWIARPVHWTWHRRPVHRVITVNGAPSPAAQFQNMQAAAYLDRQRALAQPSPAARFQIAQAQQARVMARPHVQVVPRVQAPAVVHVQPHVVVAHAAPRPAPHAYTHR